MNSQAKIDIKSVITWDMLWIDIVLDYTCLVMFYGQWGNLTNIFSQKLAKMNYSAFINYASLSINSTFNIYR
ncbi:hypothetical protein [Aphanizomenon sp. CS-733/32]|uniref:hypothetical protein n=1 Tax=Aphanizomenon sp. CS-733/32 TaxID=3021715 RepID=UPI00232B3D6C|nr:hypothetical protein [Aphanizomenon sp. CS-733/32]